MRATVACALALAAIATGCGGTRESAAARRSAATWADEICADLSRWVERARTAADHAARVGGARALRLDIGATTPPKTKDGPAAQGEVERIAQTVEQETVEQQAVVSGVPVELVEEVRTSIDRIRGLTPGGALEQALAGRPACRALRGR